MGGFFGGELVLFCFVLFVSRWIVVCVLIEFVMDEDFIEVFVYLEDFGNIFGVVIIFVEFLSFFDLCLFLEFEVCFVFEFLVCGVMKLLSENLIFCFFGMLIILEFG